MIVTCQQCATQFQLDEAKVPESGIRVRCSRCKFAFMVESPEQSSVDHGASVAHDTLATGAVGTADESESDWQFSEDIEGGGQLSANGLHTSPPDAAAAAVDDLLGSVVPVQETSEDAMLAFEPDSDSESEAPIEGAEGTDGRDAFGIGDDLSGPDFGIDESLDAAEIDLEGDSALRAPDEVNEDLSIGTDEIGEPSDLDSLGDGDGDELGPLPWDEVGAEDPITDGGFDTPTVDAASALSDDSEKTSATMDADGMNPAAFEVDVESHAATVWFARTRAGLGWAITLTLCSAALFFGLAPRTPAAPSESVPLSIAGFEAQAVRGSWVDNATAGPIYVISGSLRSAASVPPAGVELRVRLIDNHGTPIPAETAAVGPPIPTDLLREASPRDLRDRQERGARRYMRQSLAPGERRPFHAVFAGVAPAAAAFEILAAEATSGPAPEEQIVDAAGVNSASAGP